METLIDKGQGCLEDANFRLSRETAILANLSVIIPVGPNEHSWIQLLECLQELPAEAEIVLVGTSEPPRSFEHEVLAASLACDVRWVATSVGRARQLNAGAAVTSRSYLWFLHADSLFDPSIVSSLADSLHNDPRALHYFRLKFNTEGMAGMTLNTLGVSFRSRVLSLPFGDQGFCLSREVFDQLGRFDESVAFGEDHLLVWAAHRQRIRLQEVDAALVTSSRTYLARGWLRNTAHNLWRTWIQAFPQWIKYLRS